jgi:hypothetical protein
MRKWEGREKSIVLINRFLMFDGENKVSLNIRKYSEPEYRNRYSMFSILRQNSADLDVVYMPDIDHPCLSCLIRCILPNVFEIIG